LAEVEAVAKAEAWSMTYTVSAATTANCHTGRMRIMAAGLQSLACGENTERNAAAEEKRTETASWMESHTMVGYNFIAIGFGFELGVWLPWLLPKLRPMRILAFVWPLHSGGIRDFSSDFEL